ncbi:ABC transporter substrate-binding protein [Thermoflavimicrobium dichotomicum]|uniref:ABC-type nitrate/sulfonate/bicarbonate transport system, substrate-binding protein n=1 Tax=Thermoflavimicrobium dichotomicum TaxID=46223 RepID=A0A1I3P7G5_9BACL|nr:ABC transporter substrate-binding protein [Thermoflavimicrobium dichotomicum]SFJ17453.1 ABC-type nitrate/sulfonate/bicarbonate transport system, substrate-binding protein [Thermoflavimicrobium dichotomicum]
MRKWFGLFLVFCLMVLAACSSPGQGKTTEKHKKVTVVLDWTPNTNHTGLYVAKEKKYFQNEGLDVQIIQPGKTTAEQMVASKNADFGISYQEMVTQARTQNIPVISIAAIIQHNTSGFASPVAKNIKRPKDFEGKTYGAFGAPVEQQVIGSLMEKDHGDVKKVKFSNIGNMDYFTATKKGIDFAWIYYGWTGIEAELRGEKLNMLYLTDYSKDLDYYTPVIITSEHKAKQDPETVRAFMRAVAKGYRYAIEHPNEAADILIHAVPNLDPQLVKKSQAWLSPRYQAEAKEWGYQKKEVWENYARWMKEHKLLEGNFEAEKAFTNEFLPGGGK